MKEILITKGYKTLVDDDDYEMLSKHKWFVSKDKNRCYVKTAINGKNVRMHRMIMNPKKGMDVDHINNNGLDNRKANLRICTRSQNIMNSKTRSDTTSGKRGVYFQKEKGKWRAQIVVNGIYKYLGIFQEKKDAVTAREKAETELFGEYLKRE